MMLCKRGMIREGCYVYERAQRGIIRAHVTYAKRARIQRGVRRELHHKAAPEESSQKRSEKRV